MPFKSKKAHVGAENIAKRWKQQENIDQEQILPISVDDCCNKDYLTNSERFRNANLYKTKLLGLYRDV
jgi:hypothetical protein